MNSTVLLPIDSPNAMKCRAATQQRMSLERHLSRDATKTGHLQPDLVKKQLSRILHSSGFSHAARMRRFLAFIVEETLAGRTGQLCEYSIGISVFDRDESFDPSTDPIVRNDARRLRLKLIEYYRQSHAGVDDVVITVPKGSYVPEFAYASASTPGIKSEYRLSITLIRASDGIEVFVREYALHDCSLQFELVCADAS